MGEPKPSVGVALNTAQPQPTGVSVSIITPIFDDPGELERLSDTARSIDELTFVDWEHVLVGPPDGATWPQRSRRYRVDVVSEDWLGTGLASATGEYVLVLFAGDICRSDALAELVAVIADPQVGMVYADHAVANTASVSAELTVTELAELPAPLVAKPVFSPEYLRSKNYIANAAIIRRELCASDRPFPPGPVDAIHDLCLRASEAALRIERVPRVLFTLGGPPAGLTASPDAVASHLARRGSRATVHASVADTVRVRYDVDADPLVSIIVPTRGSIGREWGRTRAYVVDALRSMEAASTYPNREYVVVYDTSTPRSVLDALKRVGGEDLQLVEYSKPFNFSDKINLGVAHSGGELVLFLNDDTELIEPDSVRELAGLAQQADVGMVGARLLFADGTLQHGGHVYSGEMLHACEGWPGDTVGPRPLTPMATIRETAGITAAAAMVRREVFDEVGGFSQEFPVNFNDVDFCLKLHQAGYRNLWTPWATWYHFESVTRGRSYDDAEVDRIFGRWNHLLHHDPFYSPNLMRKRADWVEEPGLVPDPTAPDSV